MTNFLAICAGCMIVGFLAGVLFIVISLGRE